MTNYKKRAPQFRITERSAHGRILSMQKEAQCLDTLQLNKMEQSFRNWVSGSGRSDIQLSRKRILLIFLLIRYTGARLNEVLAINPYKDIDLKRHLVLLCKSNAEDSLRRRKVQMPVTLTQELKAFLDDPSFKTYLSGLFKVDPGHVRRKFYERALDCGFPPAAGAPDIIRKSRAVELMRGNMPLPVVQKMLGHSTLNVTASYVAFSDDEMRQVAKYFIEKESCRKTSARNSFFGKISSIRKGDIQAAVEMVTPGGDTVTTVITNDSLQGSGSRPDL